MQTNLSLHHIMYLLWLTAVFPNTRFVSGSGDLLIYYLDDDEIKAKPHPCLS